MHRRAFLSELGPAGLVASEALGLGGLARAAENKPRLALAPARGEFKPGDQDVKAPDLPCYEADLAKVIRGEKRFAWPPAHAVAVQETILRASGMPVT